MNQMSTYIHSSVRWYGFIYAKFFFIHFICSIPFIEHGKEIEPGMRNYFVPFLEISSRHRYSPKNFCHGNLRFVRFSACPLSQLSHYMLSVCYYLTLKSHRRWYFLWPKYIFMIEDGEQELRIGILYVYVSD